MTMTPKDAAIKILREASHDGMLTRRQPRETILSHLQREDRMHKAAIEWAESMPESVTLQSAPEYGKSPAARLQEFYSNSLELGISGSLESLARLFSKTCIEPKMREATNRPLSKSAFYNTPLGIPYQSPTIEHDGDCNLLNGADHAGCNCTARERQKMQDRITELEAERNDFKRALDDLGVTPDEARKGAARSRERAAHIIELEDCNKRMHGMIMSIRDHVGAYNTPTDPADIDITKHPLTEFFQEVAKEYNRGMAKYGRWSRLSDEKQIDAVGDEFYEWDRAQKAGDAFGPHGELAELPQLANVAGRRWRIKKKEQATNAE